MQGNIQPEGWQLQQPRGFHTLGAHKHQHSLIEWFASVGYDVWQGNLGLKGVPALENECRRSAHSCKERCKHFQCSTTVPIQEWDQKQTSWSREMVVQALMHFAWVTDCTITFHVAEDGDANIVQRKECHLQSIELETVSWSPAPKIQWHFLRERDMGDLYSILSSRKTLSNL